MAVAIDGGRRNKLENIVNSNNRRARQVGAVADLTINKYIIALEYFDDKCAYSGESRGEARSSLEHIVPLSFGGHSMLFNCIPVSASYNTDKGSHHLLDWWENTSDRNNGDLYNPAHLLKLVNYMLKSLSVQRTADIEQIRNVILTENIADIALKEIKIEPSKVSREHMEERNRRKHAFENCWPKNMKFDIASFLRLSIEKLKDDLVTPRKTQVIATLMELYNSIPKVMSGDKVIFENNPEKIEKELEIVKWLKSNYVENPYSILTYIVPQMVDKSKAEIIKILDTFKSDFMKEINCGISDLSNVLNQFPELLSNSALTKSIKEVKSILKVSKEQLSEAIINYPMLLSNPSKLQEALETAVKANVSIDRFVRYIIETKDLDKLIRGFNAQIEDKKKKPNQTATKEATKTGTIGAFYGEIDKQNNVKTVGTLFSWAGLSLSDRTIVDIISRIQSRISDGKTFERKQKEAIEYMEKVALQMGAKRDKVKQKIAQFLIYAIEFDDISAFYGNREERRALVERCTAFEKKFFLDKSGNIVGKRANEMLCNVDDKTGIASGTIIKDSGFSKDEEVAKDFARKAVAFSTLPGKLDEIYLKICIKVAESNIDPINVQKIASQWFMQLLFSGQIRILAFNGDFTKIDTSILASKDGRKDVLKSKFANEFYKVIKILDVKFKGNNKCYMYKGQKFDKAEVQSRLIGKLTGLSMQQIVDSCTLVFKEMIDEKSKGKVFHGGGSYQSPSEGR